MYEYDIHPLQLQLARYFFCTPSDTTVMLTMGAFTNEDQYCCHLGGRLVLSSRFSFSSSWSQNCKENFQMYVVDFDKWKSWQFNCCIEHGHCGNDRHQKYHKKVKHGWCIQSAILSMSSAPNCRFLVCFTNPSNTWFLQSFLWVSKPMWWTSIQRSFITSTEYSFVCGIEKMHLYCIVKLKVFDGTIQAGLVVPWFWRYQVSMHNPLAVG